MKKRFGLHCLFLALTLVLVLLPFLHTEAEAAAPGSVTVNGRQITSGYYLASGSSTVSSAKPSGGYAYFKDGVLTLNGYSGTNTAADGIYCDGDLTITLATGTKNYLYTSTAKGTNYDGVYVTGDLTLTGAGTLTVYGGKRALYAGGDMNLTGSATLVANSGLRADDKMTLNNAYVAVNQLGVHAANHAIQAVGAVSITGGALLIDTPNVVNSAYAQGIKGNGVTISGDVNITSSGAGIYSTGDLTINKGTVSVIGAFGDGMCANNITITGGTVESVGYYEAVDTFKLTITGGQLTAIASDPYVAIKVQANNSTYFKIPSNYAFVANTTITPAYDVGNVSDLNQYHYVRIGDFVVLHDVELPDGYYLASGNSANTPTTTKPSGGYAYYNDGVLYLNNYEHTGNAVSVRSFADLQISLTGGNETGMICGHKGNITFTGSGTLKVDPAMGSYGIQTQDDVTIAGGRITIEADTGIYCDNFTMTGGMAWVTATYYGLSMDGLDMQGGAITFKSTTTFNDSAYRAISTRIMSPQITIASGMNHMAGATSDPDILSTTAFTNNDLDFVALGEFVMIRGVILYKGSYMNSGATEPSQTAGSNGYAYLTDANTLLLYNYSYSGSDIAIFSNVQLNILLNGTNTLTTTSSGNNATKGILVKGNLTIKNRNSSSGTLNLNTVGTALYSEKNLTIESGTLNLTSKVGDTIYTMGDVTISGGTLHAECTCNSGSTTYDVIQADGNMSMSDGLVELDGAPVAGYGIYLPNGNLTVTGGKLYVEANNGRGIVLDKGNLTLQNARVSSSALYNGVQLKTGRLNVSSGFLKIVSTNTASDAVYCALSLKGTSSDYYNVAPALSQAGNTGNTKDYMEKLTASNMSTLDYVQIGDYIEIDGVTVRSGESISPSGAVGTGNKGAGYAYYEVAYGGNKLTLNGYTFNNTASKNRTVGAYTDLTIHVTGSNSSITTGAYNGIEVEGNLTFTGTKKLSVTSNSYAVRTTGNATLSGGDLDLYSHNNAGLYATGNVTLSIGAVTLYSNAGSALQAAAVTVNGGSLQSSAWFRGIEAESLTVNGGSVIAKTNNTGSQYAVRINALSCATGMTAMGSANSDGTNLRAITKTDLTSCKYVKISECVHKDVTTDADHKCDNCGKDGITSHVHVKYGYNSYEHWSICNCGEKIAGTTADHTFSNGTCACGKTCSITKQPVGGEVEPGDNLSVYWSTDFVPTLIEIHCITAKGGSILVQTLPGTATYASLPARSEQYVVAFFYNDDQFLLSNLFSITESVQTYTVTFKVDGNILTTKTVTHGSTVTPPADPTQTGKTFVGWYDENGTKFNFTAAITADTVLTAKFESTQIFYEVRFEVDGALWHGTAVLGGTCVEAPNAPTKTGYTFLGWYTSEGEKFDFNTPITQNTGLTAKFEADGPAPHTCTGGYATCTEAATCSICGQKYGSPNPNNHDIFGYKKATTDAKYKTHHDVKCDLCGQFFYEEEHSWGPENHNGVRPCTVCWYEPEPINYLPGDMDGDGDKDTDDAVYLLLNVLFGDGGYPIENPDVDMDNDGDKDTDDAVYLLLNVLFGAINYPI